MGNGLCKDGPGVTLDKRDEVTGPSDSCIESKDLEGKSWDLSYVKVERILRELNVG